MCVLIFAEPLSRRKWNAFLDRLAVKEAASSTAGAGTLAADDILKNLGTLMALVLATTLTSRVDINLSATETRTQIVAGIPQGASLVNSAPIIRTLLNLANGTGAGQASKIMYASDTVGSAGSGNPLTYDLTAPPDPLGGTWSGGFTAIKLLYVSNLSATAGDEIRVPTTGVATAWTAFLDAAANVILPYGSSLLLCNPNSTSGGYWTVGTNKITISRQLGGNAIPFELVVVGI